MGIGEAKFPEADWRQIRGVVVSMARVLYTAIQLVYSQVAIKYYVFIW